MNSYSNNYYVAGLIEDEYHDILKVWWEIRRRKHLAKALPYGCLLDFMEDSQWTVESVLATMKEEIKEFKNEEVQEILDIL